MRRGGLAQRKQPRHMLLAWWAIAVFAFFYLPVVLLVAFSCNDGAGIHWTGFSLRWYDELFRDADLSAALRNSLLIAAATTILSTILGTLSAWLLHRHRFSPLVKASVAGLILVPMLVPEVLMGVSLLLWFVCIHWPLGLATVIAAHVTFCFPFVLVTVRARLAGLDPHLEEAALDLGARPWEAFWRVIVPFLRPAIVGGALLAFTLSLDEYIVTVFTNGPGSQTLPQKIFGLAKIGLNPKLNALSTLFLLGTAVPAIVAEAFSRRSGQPDALSSS